MIWVFIMVFLVVFDQVTKFIVINNIEFGKSITIIDKFFYLAHWTNKGAAWGIMQNRKVILIPVTILITMGLLYFMYKNNVKILRIAITLIVGGAVGNLIDRIFRQEGVVDFLDFYIGSYHYPTFNFADCCVVVGTIILAYYLFFVYKEKES